MTRFPKSLMEAAAWLEGSDLITSRDKARALEHFASVASAYNQVVEKGLLKGLRRRERELVLRFAELETPRGRLIDVGCGGGFYARLAKKAGWHVTVLDAVPEMIAAIRGQVDEAWVADIESPPRLGLFDLVLCAGVLDFTLDPERAFANLCDLLAPSGRLVILAPRAGLGSLPYRIEKRLSNIRVNCLSPVALERQARRRGLRLRRMGYPLPLNFVAEFAWAGASD
jgi:SAM-dependent methyltransferase